MKPQFPGYICGICLQQTVLGFYIPNPHRRTFVGMSRQSKESSFDVEGEEEERSQLHGVACSSGCQTEGGGDGGVCAAPAFPSIIALLQFITIRKQSVVAVWQR